MLSKQEIIRLAFDWSNGDPEMCAEMSVELDRIYESAYAAGFKAALDYRTPVMQDKKQESP